MKSMACGGARCWGGVFLACVLLGGAIPARAVRILIDFGHEKTQMPSPDAQGNHWNNLIPIGTEIDRRIGVDLVTTTGEPSGIRLEVVGGFQHAVQPIDVPGSAIYPKEALDRWVVKTSEPGVLVLRGVRRAWGGNITIFATRGPVTKTEGPDTSYQVGSQTKTLKTVDNADACAVFTKLGAASDGTVTIRVSNVAKVPGIIGVMEIEYVEKAPGARPPGKKKGGPANADVAPPPVVPSVPSPAPVPVAPAGEVEEGGSAMRLGFGGILLLLGLGVAGFVIWFNMKK